MAARNETVGGGNAQAIERARSAPRVVELKEGETDLILERRTTNTRTFMRMNDLGMPVDIRVEQIFEPIDMDEAEGDYIHSSLGLFQALDEFEGAKRMLGGTTDDVNADMSLTAARSRHKDSLQQLLDSGYEPERIDRELNRQIATQVSNMGLGRLGEPVPQEKGDIPVLTNALRRELRKRGIPFRRAGGSR